jgi:hypothetical protein
MLMKVLHAVVLGVLIPGAIIFAQSPSVPPLPHVATGKMTERGLDWRVPLPKEGLVPDKDTATKVAEVILFRLYGERDIVHQRPYTVTEDQNIWWVCGTLQGEGFGSAFKIAISRQTAAVLYVEH